MSYEQLMGALGRGMFFRPERRRVRDFVSRDADASLVVGDSVYPIFDISMSGMSVLARHDDALWSVGDRLDVEVRLHEREIYQGPARVARVERSARGCRVGLELVAGYLDLLEIRRRDDAARFERALAGGPQRTRQHIPAAYLERIGEIAYFLQYNRRHLDRHEAMLRECGASAEAIEERVHYAADSLRDPWRQLCRSASRAAIELVGDPAILQAAKEFTETMVTPLLLDCPMCHRSYTKPLGYPGDYQVMLYYYANAFEGSSIFAKVFHKFFVEHPLSNGVRTRSEYVVDLITRELERTASEATPYRITSLGCGPAREVSGLTALDRVPDRLAWTLIDQEEEALTVAYRDARRAIAARSRMDTVQCLNVSFAQLLLEPSLMPVERKQHFIFSTGLFDYLRESRAQSLIAGLYEWLEPGGLLVIGNALGPNEHFWSPEFVLDWSLLYRSKKEMARLAATLPPGAEVEVTVEPGEAYYFLLIRRP